MYKDIVRGMLHGKYESLHPMGPISSEAVLLVAEIEALVVGLRDPKKDVEYLATWLPLKYLPGGVQRMSDAKRLLLFPLLFLLMGIGEKLKSWGIFSSIFTPLFFLLFAIALPELNGAVINGLSGLALIASGAFVIFAMPSSYGDSGVSPASVEFVVTHLNSQGFKTEKEIELLKKSVKTFEDRTRLRVAALKWTVGLLWGGFTYIFIKGVELSISSPAQALRSGELSGELLLLLAAVYFSVWGYEAAVDKLFRIIELGCNDFCHHAETQKQIEALEL